MGQFTTANGLSQEMVDFLNTVEEKHPDRRCVVCKYFVGYSPYKLVSTVHCSLKLDTALASTCKSFSKTDKVW